MKLMFLIAILLTQTLFASDAIRSYKVDNHSTKLQEIANRFEVVKRLSNGFEVYVKEVDAKSFVSLAPQAVLLEKNIHSSFNDKSVSGYKKFIDVEKDLINFEASYKNMATLVNYGTSADKRKLYALKIDTQVNQSHKPELMITAATHGDELITVEVLISLMKELFSQYGKDSRITKMLDNHTIYFIPVVSPDSFDARSRYVEGTDPNRCYPWPENPKNKPVAVIQSLMNFTNQHNLAGSLDLHAYGRLVMYPWGYTDDAPNSADAVVMNDLVQDMAKDNQYTAGQISTTIYIAKGSSADYYYWNKKTRAIAAEIGNDKVPSYSKIPSMVNESREMIYRFIESFN
jgi:hypothetical protein